MTKTTPTHNDIIKSYLIETYTFSTNTKDWCVIDKANKRSLELQQLIKLLNKVFPNMNPTYVVTNWWAENIAMNTGKIYQFLSNYRLVQTSKGMVWATISKTGKEFNVDDLMKILPSHFKSEVINRIYEEWFDEQKYEETKKLMYGKSRHL